MKRVAIILFVIVSSLAVNAQWRIGLTVGATYNSYSRDNHYMSDWHYKGAWGKIASSSHYVPIGTIGVMGQYDFNDWFGIRADLNWTNKANHQYRTMVSTDFETLNNYIQLPVMASFSFGNQKLRGFLNVGVYGGYWINSYYLGGQQFVTSGTTITGIIKNDFDEKRDQRFDYGLVGGIGIEWRFKFLKKNWAWQIVEARYYYSTKSIQKDYMRIQDPRYNTTLALQSGLCYYF